MDNTRIYQYMDGILGALGSGEDNGMPTPAWRFEEYLKSIYDAVKAGGGSSGGGVLVVHDVNGTLDKTWNEIKTAMCIGGAVVTDGTSAWMVCAATLEGTSHEVATWSGSFFTKSSDGYPASL